jgi:serine/threonine-protein kinase ULK/ATG1
VFDNPVIKMDEESIRQNMKNIMQEKDALTRSVSLNKLYIDQNLVVGYLELNPEELQKNSQLITSTKTDQT